MKVSECCGSIPWNDSDICAECRKHANFIDYVKYNTQILLKENLTMTAAGLIAIGNDEKCPYCDKIMKKETDNVKHLLSNHKEKVMEELFNE